MQEDPVLCAYDIHGNGMGTALSGADVAHRVEHDELAWVHLDGNNPAAREWLQREVSYLDKIILDALLAEETRPRLLEFDKGIMLILRGVNLNENSDPEDMVSIRLWVDESRIISVRRRRLKAVQDIRDALDNGTGPRNAGDFVSMLVARLFDRMAPVLSDLDDELDGIEEDVIDNPDVGERQSINALRKRAILFRRYIAPQKEVIAHLRTLDSGMFDAVHKRHLQESLERVTLYVEDLDAIRERAQIVKDELANILADRMNKNMYVLSIVAAIFMPLGFLTGLFGINVGGMPGVDSADAFWIICVGLVAIVALQVFVFKKMKWF